jgi:hypothetical protein
MPVVSTRPGIKVRVPVKFPARVTVQSPLILTQTGATYEFSLDAAAVTGGDITVWQLRCALGLAGNFFAVDAAIPVDPGGRIYEAWTSGGLHTSSGDDLYDAIVLIIGAPATIAAYASAEAITL